MSLVGMLVSHWTTRRTTKRKRFKHCSTMTLHDSTRIMVWEYLRHCIAPPKEFGFGLRQSASGAECSLNDVITDNVFVCCREWKRKTDDSPRIRKLRQALNATVICHRHLDIMRNKLGKSVCYRCEELCDQDNTFLYCEECFIWFCRTDSESNTDSDSNSSQ